MLLERDMLGKKSFTCPSLFHHAIDTVSDTSSTILVMIPVDAGFSGGYGAHLFYSVFSQPLHCTSHLGSDCSKT